MVGAVTGNAFGSAGRRAAGTSVKAGGAIIEPKLYPNPGNFTFTPIVAGLYAFRLWGPGGRAIGSIQAGGSSYVSGGAGAGGYAKKTVRLAAGQAVSLVVGIPGFGTGTSTTNVTTGGTTSASLPSGTVSATAGQDGANSSTGSGGAGGAGGGGDINLTGGAGGTGSGAAGSTGGGNYPGTPGSGVQYNGGGGSAPGDDTCAGGNGGSNGATPLAPSPGGGAGGKDSNSTSNPVYFGGNGQIIVTYEGP